jgi:hypothetical protein
VLVVPDVEELWLVDCVEPELPVWEDPPALPCEPAAVESVVFVVPAELPELEPFVLFVLFAAPVPLPLVPLPLGLVVDGLTALTSGVPVIDV